MSIVNGEDVHMIRLFIWLKTSGIITGLKNSYTQSANA